MISLLGLPRDISILGLPRRDIHIRLTQGYIGIISIEGLPRDISGHART